MAGSDISSRSSIPVGLMGQQTLFGPFLVAGIGAALWTRPLASLYLLPAVFLTGSTMTFASLAIVGLLFGVHSLRSKLPEYRRRTIFILAPLGAARRVSLVASKQKWKPELEVLLGPEPLSKISYQREGLRGLPFLSLTPLLQQQLRIQRRMI